MSLSKDYEAEDVVADIYYFPANLKQPINHDEKELRKLCQKGVRPMKIKDARGREDQFDHRKNGFAYITLPEKDRPVDDKQFIKENYWPEIEDAVKNLTGADTVHVWGDLIRAADWGWEAKADPNSPQSNGPAGRPHVDYIGIQPPFSDYQEILRYPSGFIDIPPLLAKNWETCSRYVLFNVWRPIKTITKSPLAMCDCASVDDKDWMMKSRVFSDTGKDLKAWVMAHGEKAQTHEWWYLNEQKPNEIIYFTGWDSDQSQPGWRTPHTAFVKPGTENEPTRESIEVRGIAWWK